MTINENPTTFDLQREDGSAALYLAAALLLAMPFFLLVVEYTGAADTAEKVALLAAPAAGR